MGAISVDVTGRGYSMEEAFNILSDEAKEETGSDYYSGGINNCILRGDISHMVNSKTDIKAVEYAVNNADKGEVFGWCIKKPVQNSNKTKSKVTRNPNKGTRVWKTVYVAKEKWNDKVYAEAGTLQACIDKARKLVEKDPDLYLEVKLEKKLVKGDLLCATISYKKSTNQKPGLYRFIGSAPY